MRSRIIRTPPLAGQAAARRQRCCSINPPLSAVACQSAPLSLSESRGVGRSGDDRRAERLRQRLLHIAAKLVRHGRRTHLKVDRDWPWSTALAVARERLLKVPALC